MSAKAIFFDANGVLYHRPQGDHYLEAFLKDHAITADIAAARAGIEHLHDQSMRGKVKLLDYQVALLKACGVREPALVETGLEAIRKDQANITLFDGVIETIQQLKIQKIKVGIITDAAVSKVTKLNWFMACGLNIAWDAYANSMDLCTRKPDPRMYKVALEQACITKYDAVFVGHAAHEIKGARDVGLTTVAFNPDEGVEVDYFIEHFSDLLELPLYP